MLDSLLFNDVLAEYFKNGGNLADIGSGCGCPAIPLKITFPQLNVTMLDSVRKKVDFLNETVKYLGLGDIRAVHTRIEDHPVGQMRGFYNFVTARAVAPLPTLLEYGLPLLKIGGFMFAYKGLNLESEIEQSKRALDELGGEVLAVHTARLDDVTERKLLIVKKVHQSKSVYPRKKNLPRTSPL